MKRALVVVVLLSLACAGAAEKALELSTGGEFELSEEHSVMVIEGQRIEVFSGTQASMPPDCPFPAYQGATLSQTMVLTPVDGGVGEHSVVWQLTAPTEQVVEFYRQHLESQGLTVTSPGDMEGLGVSTRTLVAEGDPLGRKVIVSDAMGTKTVTASWSAGEAPDLQQNPDHEVHETEAP